MGEKPVREWQVCREYAGPERHVGRRAGVEVYVRRCTERSGDVGPKTCAVCSLPMFVESVKGVEDLGRHNRCAEVGEQCMPEGLCLEGLMLWELMHQKARAALATLEEKK